MTRSCHHSVVGLSSPALNVLIGRIGSTFALECTLVTCGLFPHICSKSCQVALRCLSPLLRSQNSCCCRLLLSEPHSLSQCDLILHIGSMTWVLGCQILRFLPREQHWGTLGRSGHSCHTCNSLFRHSLSYYLQLAKSLLREKRH